MPAPSRSAGSGAPGPPPGATPRRRGGAVVLDKTLLDYADLGTRVTDRAEALARAGVQSRQVVRVPTTPALDLLVMQHALARLGCGLLPLAGHAEGSEGPLTGLIAAEWIWRPGGSSAGILAPTGLRGPEADGPRPRVALVVETSGSGGQPKAVMLTPGNLLASASLVNRRLALGPNDCWLCCLPLHHVGGLMIGYRCALAGACLVLHEGFDAAAVARDLARHRVTHLSLVPPMLARLLDRMEGPPPSLRVLLVGGQALSPALAARALAGGWPLHLTYGMTETTSQVATSERLQEAPEGGRVGPVLAGVEVACEGRPEHPGRIRVRGPVVMAGYGNPQRQAGDGLDGDGWLSTRDLGYITSSGELAVVGRADDLLVIGGESILPARVEARLAGAPGVSAAVVAPLPDPVWGHRLAAAYMGDVRAESLEAWCRASLPGRERPRVLLRVSTLPLLSSGKIDRVAVRALLQAKGEADDRKG